MSNRRAVLSWKFDKKKKKLMENKLLRARAHFTRK